MVTRLIATPWGKKYMVRTCSELVRDRVKWAAVEQTFSKHKAIGHGSTEQEAIADLVEQLAKRQSFDWTPPTPEVA